MFLGLLDPDPDPTVRGMDPDPDLDASINKLFIFENDLQIPSKCTNQKNLFQKLFFCYNLRKVYDENSRIRIRDQ
jgi:hypothetical protein